VNSKIFFEHGSYQFHPDHVYVVVGNNFALNNLNTKYLFNTWFIFLGNKSDWLDVTEWLVDRGAQKIVIVVKCFLMSSTTCRNRFLNRIIILFYSYDLFWIIFNRFDKLMSRNISVQIQSFLYFKTRKESLEWLTRLASSSVLGSLLIVNQVHYINKNTFFKVNNTIYTTHVFVIAWR